MILERLIGAATPNNPSFNLNSERDWDNFALGPPSAAGVRVNRDTALSYSPFWRGVNLLARDTARLPLHNYSRKPNGGRERNKAHSSYQVMRWKANQYQTAFHLKLQLTGHAVSGGNGYAYINRRGDGTIVPPSEGGGVVPLDPNTTTPVREWTGTTSALWYVVKVGGENRKLPAEDILHIKGLGYDGLVGYDVIQFARDSIGLGKAQERYRSRFFSNGAHLKVVLETPGHIGPKQANEILDSWSKIQGGLENAHKTAILHSGLKAHALSNTARESQLAEGVEMSIRDAANILGIPPHKLGAKTGESYASKEQENLDYLLQALDFWLVAWEDECHDKLLTEEEKDADSAYFEFAREKLFETDLKTKAEYFRVSLGGHPWNTPNEARLAFNLEPIEGFDSISAPSNMPSGPATEEEDTGKPPEAEPEDEDEEEDDEPRKAAMRSALTYQLRDTVHWLVTRIGQHAERAHERGGKFMDWLEAFPGDQAKVIADRASLAESICNAWFGRADTQQLSGWIIDTTRADLLEWSGTVTPAKVKVELPEQIKRLDEKLQTLAVTNLIGGDDGKH